MKRYQSILTTLILLFSFAISLCALPAIAAAADVGYRDFQFGANCDATPTGEKPESKLWWNDGIWWASMCTPGNTYHIYKLNLSNQTWEDTGTLLDNRANSRADVLWDDGSQKLYVASHIFALNGAPTQTPADWGRLYRYSYHTGTKTYSLDTGFPVNVTNGVEEALVLAKDSTGKLWVTYVESRKVKFNHSTTSDTTWGTPKTLNAPGTTNLTNSDIASIIAFDVTTASPKIGVFWSNSTDKKMYFAVHQDSNSNDQAWTSFGVYTSSPQNPAAADDHINMKLQSDGQGVYVVTKTSNTNPSQPLIVLLACTSGCINEGNWQASTVYTKAENHTRAILLIDTDQDILNVFSTFSAGGGAIYRKSSPINNISFPSGHGSVFIGNASDPVINNPTSTKDNVNGTTGLVILASDETTRRYLHNYDALGGPPAGPTADFSGTPTTGTAPLSVTFSDLSTGTPISWSWDFDDDGTPDSSVQNPSFIYNNPGTYTVKLTVTNASGSDSETKTGYITVSPGGGGSTLTFSASDDAYVKSDSAASNFGSATTLRVRTSGTTTLRSYLKFNVSGLTGPVSSAKLRVFVGDPSSAGGSAYLAANSSWSESTINCTNQPGLSGTALSTAGAASTGTWVEFNLGGSVTGNGTYSFALSGGVSDAVYYNSSEATSNQPQLVVTQSGSPTPPVADFSGTPTTGTAPLSVTFSDLSTGTPTSWSWDFDDDGTPNSSVQNPSFVYNNPGTYTVKLTVTNVSGSDSETKTSYITANPAGSTRIKEITFENGNGSNNLTDPTTGADSTFGTVSLETSAPINGSFSATIPNVASSYLQENFSAADDIYISFVLRISARPSATVRIAQLANAGVSIGTVQLLSDGRLQLRDSNDNTTVGTSTTALTPGQLYRVGLHQRKGSGSNAVLEAYLAVGTDPFGAPFAAKTSGTWTTAADRLRLGVNNAVILNATFDDIKLDTAVLPN